MIADGIKSVHKQGVCREDLWTYSDSGTKFMRKPGAACYQDALKMMNLDNIKSINQDLYTLKSVLSKNIPIVFGIAVYDSFMSYAVATTGIVPMPDTSKENLQGWHALFLIGYDDGKQAFLLQNSWSANWGIGGRAWIPYDYILNPNLTDDIWGIDKVGAGAVPPQPKPHLPTPSEIIGGVSDFVHDVADKIRSIV
jgi:hypothetical protein